MLAIVAPDSHSILHLSLLIDSVPVLFSVHFFVTLPLLHKSTLCDTGESLLILSSDISLRKA
jgi:hypothetical protein